MVGNSQHHRCDESEAETNRVPTLKLSQYNLLARVRNLQQHGPNKQTARSAPIYSQNKISGAKFASDYQEAR